MSRLIQRALRLNNKAVESIVHHQHASQSQTNSSAPYHIVSTRQVDIDMTMSKLQRSLCLLRLAMKAEKQQQPQQQQQQEGEDATTDSARDSQSEHPQDSMHFTSMDDTSRMSACQVKQQHASRNSDTTGAEHVCWNFILFRTTPADAKNKKRRAGTMATYSEQDMRLYASAVMFNVALYNHAIAESCQRVPNGMAETYTMHDSECFRSRAISVYQYILIALQHDTRPMASLVQMLGCNNLATQHASHKSKFQLVANFMAQSTQPLVNAMVGQETTNGILLNILLSSIHRAASAA